MSDRIRVLPFEELVNWVLTEYESKNSIFGVPKEKFYGKPSHKPLRIFDQELETPLGPAAGPNTQLAQNIVAAYVAGSRFFELKTVQIIDGEDLPVSKPCILIKEEGYNVEWSTELTVSDALNEYIKAWFLLKLLSKELALGSNQGFIFNMSVGYDLEGIKSHKIDTFIDNLKDASQTAIWKECKDCLLNHLQRFKYISKEYIEEISSEICQSITLSTLHGCPPTEIERIATYLLEEKKLSTYIKCNPTLLGYKFSRSTLDRLGYEDLVFDDHHFKNDLKFEEAVPMIARLKALAKELGLTFGVKLTNTFPVMITNKELPGEEMYLSGKPLYPLTINLAYRLAKEFEGDIRISYSGGADYFNIRRIYQTGIWPITLTTTLLKPGGYLRLKQLAASLESEDQASEFIGIEVEKLKLLSEEALSDANYRKSRGEQSNRKLGTKVPITDCFIAPCKYGCPIKQEIPEYIRLVGEGRYLEALEVIIEKNPLPFITGTLCNHLCMTKCTRLDYDEPVRIREMKLIAAQKAFPELIKKLEPPEIKSSFKVAIIGGGPAGLSGAYFLRKYGIDVTVFEKKASIGGVIQQVAPYFRISREAIDQDLELIRKMGVRFCLGVDANFSIEALKEQGFQYILIAIGAWKPYILELEACDKDIINALEFLEAFKKSPESLKLGKHIAIIGAGNSAMDAARAAKRVPGVEKVSIIYRRTSKYMPANQEELELARMEGVEWRELLAPVSYVQGVLRCQKLSLGAFDNFGRRSPVAISGEFTDLWVDNIIAAVGEQLEAELLVANHIKVDDKGRVIVNPLTNETNIENVFIAGDALRGPATIVDGIADGTKYAHTVMDREKWQYKKLVDTVECSKEKHINEVKHIIEDKEIDKQLDNQKDNQIDKQLDRQIEDIINKKGVLQYSCYPLEENNRCLECNIICNSCVEVCPNRANLAVSIPSNYLKNINQILHMDGMCNECGNCESFCPYDSAPYREKFTLYWNEKDFEYSRNDGFFLIDQYSLLFRVRIVDHVEDVTFDNEGNCTGDIPKDIAVFIWTVYQDYSYILY